MGTKEEMVEKGPETAMWIDGKWEKNHLAGDKFIDDCIAEYFLGHKIHPCLSTNFVSEATMVVSGFGPYHHLVHDDAPTEHADVILTPWAMPLALGLGTIHLGGEWHVPLPP